MESPQESQDLETLGGRIRAVRKARKLKAIAVSNYVGISRVTFWGWETGEVREPGVYQLFAFTKLADINLSWLLVREGPDPEILKPIPSRPKRR